MSLTRPICESSPGLDGPSRASSNVTWQCQLKVIVSLSRVMHTTAEEDTVEFESLKETEVAARGVGTNNSNDEANTIFASNHSQLDGRR